MKQKIESAIGLAVQGAFNVEVRVQLVRPEEQFGDYATNVALQLAAKLGKNPQEVAESLAAKLRTDLADKIKDVTVAAPGFINLKLSDKCLLDCLTVASQKSLANKKVVAEYSDPNPFKVLHAGHLYTSVVGDAIANLLEHAGAEVHRVNFGGDVGLHVAKTLWAMERALKGELPQKYNDRPVEERAEWMAKCYVSGSQAYETDAAAKESIVNFNKMVYEIHAKQDYTSYIAQIYWMGREWSYEYFRKFYERTGTHFEKYYPESEVAETGLKVVREQLSKGIYEQSDGAVIFSGEKFGLHTRVFINSEGLPTYETKDVGLIFKKYEDYHFDKSVVITGNEQEQYMNVVLKSIEQFAPQLAEATVHLTHGMVRLEGNQKMSSRKGNFLKATDVLDAAAAANKELTGQDQNNEQTVLGAVKYAFLKVRTGGDIIYDPKESVSLEGNSGPYLQYAHARARSILAKAQTAASIDISELQPDERSLIRKIGEYTEVVDQAVDELMPHHICTYLYELAQIFNRFYEHNRVVGDAREAIRLQLVAKYADTLKKGLELLGIAAPDHI